MTWKYEIRNPQSDEVVETIDLPDGSDHTLANAGEHAERIAEDYDEASDYKIEHEVVLCRPPWA